MIEQSPALWVCVGVGVGLSLELIEKAVRGFGLAAGTAVLIYMLWQGVWRGLHQPAGLTTGQAGRFLRIPVLSGIAVIWIGACALLWRPIPLVLGTPWRMAALLLGSLLYFSGIWLYLWGAHTLGAMYRPSSSVGVQLHQEPRLVTDGPFALVRHPLYLGLQTAALGGFLLFRTWTFAFVAVNFIALIFRARREEQALAAAFGEEWQAYADRVPLWWPRWGR